jgi:hypothetical protein
VEGLFFVLGQLGQALCHAVLRQAANTTQPIGGGRNPPQASVGPDGPRL